jgi:hypothetical protein
MSQTSKALTLKRKATDSEEASSAKKQANTLSQIQGDSPDTSIGLQLPRYLHVPFSYSLEDVAIRQPLLFYKRHCDIPAVFLQASSYLFSAEQQLELSALFHPGWQNNKDSPLHSLIGSCRPSSSHRTQAYDHYAARDASAASFVRKAMCGQQLVVSDLNLARLPQAQSLCKGPALFGECNIWKGAATDPNVSSHDHVLCFGILGTSQ